MPKLNPFQALQAKPEYISQVTANSANFDSDSEIAAELKKNPLSFLHVTRNHLLRSENVQSLSTLFENSKEYFSQLIEKEIVKPTEGDIFYVYRQTHDDVSHTGIIGLCDIVDYQRNRIRKHEHTRPSTEMFVANLMETVNMIGEPLLLSHHHKQSLEDLLRWVIQTEPNISFEKKGKGHQIWVINDPDIIRAIQTEVGAMEDFYIMDGHHRAASVSNLYHESEDESKRYCMAYLLDSSQLKISSFHRLVKVDSMNDVVLFEQLRSHFWVEEVPDYAVHPEHKGEFILKCSSGSYRLQLKEAREQLDVRELENHVLSNIFQISDSRLDDRISFISTQDELTDAIIESQLPNTYLFLLHPCTFEDIALISDNDEFMPPKSTFVEPKCDSGLFIQPYGE